MDHVVTKRILRGAWVCLVVLALCLSFYWVLPLIYPFLIAWIIAYAMNPFVRWLQATMKLPRWASVTLALLVYFAAGAIVITAAVTRLVKEMIHLADTINVHIGEWRDLFVSWGRNEELQRLISDINSFIVRNPGYNDTFTKNVDNAALTISSAISRMITSFLNGVINVITSLPSLALILLIILLSAFFISNGWDKNKRMVLSLVPQAWFKTGNVIRNNLQMALFGYLRAQFIMITITAFVVCIGLLILRVGSPVTYAILIGLVDLLPYLGVGTILIPWLTYAFMTGNLALGIGLSILYGVVLISRQLIEPKVLATSVGLDPLPTLISLFVGLRLFGVLGLIIGPFSLVVINAIIKAGVINELRDYVMNGRLR